ncbi:ectoine/hydroxyectoine ABC transporter permease subunit EhuC [Kocuria turfanensis]|uniref:Ectoine/hydroxyectoine ABC transporter permease subunit EhuC n=1 Tax=Kocuria turfanensis TaxID=388357 RepID=A0A512IA10_9MICC|nr:ectoine/hydroxyectoine ABC transporter permease subunit EhuC [Kocuria turfanensis]GEO94467.1 ectoine/hydroxyectoine ABC transporter permease subunit EhuC [Kocuria turfanensis]
MRENLAVLWDFSPRLVDGVLVTLQLTLGGALGAFVVAVALGLASRSEAALLRGTARVVVEFFRGTSLLVQLFWLFFVLPLLGVRLEPMTVGVLALALNYGAYGAEVVRGSIASVDRGQWEATHALGMSGIHRMRRIIFPQAWALMIPSLANLLIQLLKGTAVVSFITLSDLNFHVVQLRQATGDTLFAFTVGLLIYFVLAYLLNLGMNVLEIRAKNSLGRGPSMREIWRPTRPESAEVGGGTP